MFNKRQHATITAITRSLRFAPESKRKNLSCFSNSWHQYADCGQTKQGTVIHSSSRYFFHSGMNMPPSFQGKEDDL
jgi:hypothetical protein